MNELIEEILSDLVINKRKIPVAFAYYDGHGQPYVTYQRVDYDSSFSADDDLRNWIEYVDIDIYSKGNWIPIEEEVMHRMISAGFIWQVDRSGGDLYEPDTGYYHKNLNFAYIRGVNDGENWTE